MAYYNKYKFTFATRANKTAYLYLQEDLGSAPTVIEYPGKDLNLQYIPNSDDPFEPIFASQLGVSIDVTDDISNIPNLTTLNDRKYFAKLYLDATLEWCGWVLSDGASISYSTGRKMMSFNAIDGLGMLDKIPLPIATSTDINSINTLLYFIRLCLNSNGFPINPNIMTVCSYYATGMTDRTTNSYSEPFNQAYLPYRTFIETGVTYISCLQVLSNIVKSFGCRLFQAGGKWWIVAVNQFANQNNWYTEYTYTGTVAASGSNLNTLSTIQAYTGNTSRLYFIDNSQTKLLKKGFNRIEDNYEIKMTPNYFSNGNFRPYVAAQASNWQAQWNGGAGNSVTIIDNATDESAQYRLNVNNSTGSTAWIETNPSSLIKIPAAVALEISWIFQGQDLSSSPRGVVYLTIADAVNVYYWNGTIWTTSSQFMIVPAYSGAAGGDTINSYSFKTLVTPIAGSLKFKFSLENGTGRFAQISNIKLTITSSIKSQNYYSYITSNLDYVKTIDIPYGAQTANDTYPSEIGMIVLSNNVYAGGWYEYGGATTYGSLLLLLMQKYMNVYGKNIINLDCDLSSFSTTNGILNASKLFKATDTDPSSINIASNSYMLGNSTTDYAADRTNATLLQISNTNISATNGYITSFNDLI
jgi:hypothetical protein